MTRRRRSHNQGSPYHLGARICGTIVIVGLSAGVVYLMSLGIDMYLIFLTLIAIVILFRIICGFICIVDIRHTATNTTVSVTAQPIALHDMEPVIVIVNPSREMYMGFPERHPVAEFCPNRIPRIP
jgi:hypothetical protein